MESYYLSDIEAEKLIQFNTDPIMREAVRKILLAGVYLNGVLEPGKPGMPKRNFALALAFREGMTNEMLGQDLRAAAEGIRTIETAFDKIAEYVPVAKKSNEKKGNKAV